MKKYLLVIIVFFGLTCKSPNGFERKDYNSVTFGLYCEECSGDCFQGFYFKNENAYKISLSFTDFSNIAFIDLDTLSDKKALGSVEKEKLNNILRLLPKDIEQEKEIIGNPDNHDQCGIMIYLKTTKLSKRFFIDTDKDKCPKRFHNFIDSVNDLKLL